MTHIIKLALPISSVFGSDMCLAISEAIVSAVLSTVACNSGNTSGFRLTRCLVQTLAFLRGSLSQFLFKSLQHEGNSIQDDLKF